MKAQETPSEAKFNCVIARIVTDADAQQLENIAKEVRRVFSEADHLHPRELRRGFVKARVAHESAPTDETYARVKEAAAPEGIFLGNPLDQSHRFKALKKAAHIAAWAYYRKEAVPILYRLYDAAILRVEEEIKEQKERERQWLDAAEAKIAPWMAFYGASGARLVPAATPLLCSLLETLRRVRAQIPVADATEDSLPSIMGFLRSLGWTKE